MNVYGDTDPLAIARRIDQFDRPRLLDALCWFRLGVAGHWPCLGLERQPIPPAEQVCGRDMAFGIAQGYTDLASAFCVPPLSADLGAATRLAELRHPDARIAVSTGAVPRHRARVTFSGGLEIHGSSAVGASRAVLCALLRACAHPNAG